MGAVVRKRLIIIPACFILGFLFFTVFGERGLLRIYHLDQEKQEIQNKAETLRLENEKLKREIEALRSDRRYLESIARRDFGLVRANETIYQFPSADKAEPPPGSVQATPAQSGTKFSPSH